MCFCRTCLFTPLFSYSDVALQSSAGGSRQEKSYQVLKRSTTNPKGKSLIVLLEISFRAQPSSHTQLFIVGLPLYLPKVLDSLWRGDISSVSPHLQKELWHFCNSTHQEISLKLTFITPNQNTAKRLPKVIEKVKLLLWTGICFGRNLMDQFNHHSTSKPGGFI